MRNLPTLRVGATITLLLLTGCQEGSGASPTAAAPASGTPASCEKVCNSEYDSCMDRFGNSGSLGRHSDDANASLGPDDVCPDQLKSCLKRCLP